MRLQWGRVSDVSQPGRLVAALFVCGPDVLLRCLAARSFAAHTLLFFWGCHRMAAGLLMYLEQPLVEALLQKIAGEVPRKWEQS